MSKTEIPEDIAAPAFRTALQDSAARSLGGAVSRGCCVDPLRPPSILVIRYLPRSVGRVPTYTF